MIKQLKGNRRKKREEDRKRKRVKKLKNTSSRDSGDTIVLNDSTETNDREYGPTSTDLE